MVMSQVTELMQKKILDVLQSRPMTPTEIGKFIGGLDRSHVQRQYLKPMLEAGQIFLVEGTHKYQLKGSHNTAQTIKLELASKDEFYQTETIGKNWMPHAKTTKTGMNVIASFQELCLGKVTRKFKINPDAWIHPSTTIECVEKLREHYGVRELSFHPRKVVRQFLKYGLKLTITKEDAKDLGLSGEKDNIGDHARVSFEHGEYAKAKEYFKTHFKNSLPLIKFGFKFWTFGRPSSILIVKLSQLEFYDRKIEYVHFKGSKKIISHTIDGEKIIPDKIFYEMVQDADSEKYDVVNITERACFVRDFVEFKTDSKYPKYIYDQEIVIELEKYAKERLSRGFKYLFWDNNETEFTLDNYDSLVRIKRTEDNQLMKDLYTFLESKDEYCFSHSNYSMRHIGIQHWLQLSDYNYGFIAEMGWEDIDTLITWYGKRTKSAFDKKMASVIA